MPDDILSGVTEISGKKAGITIGQGDKSALPDGVRAAIGDRPLVKLILTLGGVEERKPSGTTPVHR